MIAVTLYRRELVKAAIVVAAIALAACGGVEPDPGPPPAFVGSVDLAHAQDAGADACRPTPWSRPHDGGAGCTLWDDPLDIELECLRCP